MRPLQVRKNILISVRELLAMPGIAARFQLSILSVHIPLNRRDVPDQIGKREFSVLVSPIDPLRRDALDDSQCALPDPFVVFKERADSVDFHWFAPNEF